MRIRSVALIEFKRFDELTIDLGVHPKKIISLVGPNGCGKSSVFDAFEEKLKDFRNSGSESIDFYLKSMFYEDTALKKTIYQKNNAIKIININGNSNFELKSFYIRTSYRFTSKVNVSQISSKGAIIDEARPLSSIAIDSRLQSNYERLLGTAYSEFEKGNKTGSQVKEELIGKLNGILKEILEIQISSFGNVVENKGSLYFQKENTTNFPYANLSSGEKEVVDIILDLVVKADIYNDTVFCIDEPELHLNTSIQRKLLVEIEKLIPENCQLWIATHSIGFLRALQEELKEKVQILDFGERDYFRGKKTIFPILPTRENWQRIFSTALDDLTHLVSPKIIIYCEGNPMPLEGAEQGLDAIIYNYLFEEEFPDTLFISAGGRDVTGNAALALQIISKAFIGVTLLRIKDKDIRTQLERKEFLGESPNNRMLMRREIENYLFDKEVLRNYSKQKCISFNETKYDLYVINILDQDLKLVQQHIQHSVSSFGPISDFKEELRLSIPKGGLVYNELKMCIL